MVWLQHSRCSCVSCTNCTGPWKPLQNPHQLLNVHFMQEHNGSSFLFVWFFLFLTINYQSGNNSAGGLVRLTWPVYILFSWKYSQLDLKHLTAFIFFADVTMYSFSGRTLQSIGPKFWTSKLERWFNKLEVYERTEFRVISCPRKCSTGILRGTKLVNGVDPRDSKQVELLPRPTTSVHIPNIFCWSNTWC